MTERIHDREADTSEAAVRSLLDAQCTRWASLPLTPVGGSGTSNAMWRVHAPDGDDVVRLPRIGSAAESMDTELELLPRLATTSLTHVVAVPTVRHAGYPTDRFPHRWAVLGWLDGSDAWTVRHRLEPSSADLASDLARAVGTIGQLDGLPGRDRRASERGGPLHALLARLERWLDDPVWSAPELVDVTAIRRSAAQSAEAATAPVEPAFTHGDLIPGNLLVTRRRLAAVIDWGGAAYGDPAQDLAPAWAVLDAGGRRVFREEVGADDATWLRARAFELEHAVGGVLYYTPRGHQLAQVMARTLDRILDE